MQLFPLNPHSPFFLHCVERLQPNALVTQRGPSEIFCSNPQSGGHILMAAPRKSLCAKLKVEHCSAVGGLGGVHNPSVQTRYFVQSDDWVQMISRCLLCKTKVQKEKNHKHISRSTIIKRFVWYTKTYTSYSHHNVLRKKESSVESIQ